MIGGATWGNPRIGLNFCPFPAAYCFPLAMTGTALCISTRALCATTIILCVATITLQCRWHYLLFPFCGRRRVRSRIGSDAQFRPMQAVQTNRAQRVSLPVEVIEHIADYLFEPGPPATDHTGTAAIICSKQPWAAVEGFMNSNVHLHKIGFVRWMRVVSVIDAGDWAIIFQYSQFVREIQCLDGALSGTAHQHALARLSNLHVARIDVHSDVRQSDNNRFTYQDVFTALPSSLRRLEVINAHGPDVNVIATVKKCCPRIEELRLGRCTMFNRIPACDFWCTYAHDHDAYISAEGTASYAHSLGGELSPLKNLRSLRMGLYLVPFDIVLAHRLYHRHGRLAPAIIDWQTAIPLSELPVNPFTEPHNMEPATTEQLVSILHQRDSEPGAPFDCQFCSDTTAGINKITEMTANGILRGYIPSLDTIEWMAWLTSGHLGVHSFTLSE